MADQEIQQTVATIVKNILEKAGFTCDIAISEPLSSGNVFIVNVDSGDNTRLLIGKNGNNLKALEHLAKVIAFRDTSGHDHKTANFIVDIDNYRRSKTDQLIGLAQEAAQRVARTRKAEALEPMSPYERRVVHMELASYHDIQTESIGEEPRRRIVVKPDTI